MRLPIIFALFIAPLFTHADQDANPNLALQATASAAESQNPDMTPDKANDGRTDTRWSNIPGHNGPLWYELDWAKPVTIGAVLVRQYDRFSYEWDIQTWDEASQQWQNAGHYGKDGTRLPLNVLCPVEPPRTTAKLRIANITHGPSFNEVEVYAPGHFPPPTIELASDLRGNFIAMLCDRTGAAPIPGKQLTLSGPASANGGWSATATTDEHGLAFIPMPVGLNGDVTASGDGIPSRTFPSQAFQRAVTPISTETHPVVLDKGWHFAVNPPDGFEKPGFDSVGWKQIKVPAHWIMQGFKGDTGGYRLRFDVPPGAGRLMLRFDGVYSGAKVWVNGEHVADHEGGFTPFEADITNVVNEGENLLALKVTEHTNVSDNLDRMSYYADFPLAGIMRKVTLFWVPTVHVEAYDYATRFASDMTSATIDGRVAVLNRTGATLKGLEASLTLLDSTGQVAARGAANFGSVGAETRGGAPFAFAISHPVPWNAEHPMLYRLSIRVHEGAKTLQTLTQVIGLRQTEVEGTQLLIDKTAVKLRGTCHHDSDPLLGRAVTPALELKDLKLIKEANLNAVRTSHYPPMPELIADADKLGVYVEDEADFCWVGVSDDLRNTPRILQLEGELLARDRNHPSVCWWSLCNESGFGFGFDRAHEFVRRTDPSRPTSAATSASSEIDTQHNPIMTSRIHEQDGNDKPVMWDEAWCIWQGIHREDSEMWVDPGLRDYYVEPLKPIFDAMMASKVVQGSMIWCWADDLFMVPGRGFESGRGTMPVHFAEPQLTLPGRGLVGDGAWGVVDGWRRKKPEFWITKKLQSPIRIEEKPVDTSQPVSIPVINQYDFVNLKELSCVYSVGGTSGKVVVDIAPHASGSISIPSVPGHAGEPLRIKFYARSGELVDGFEFPSSTKPSALASVSKPSPLSVEHESILEGETTRIFNDRFEIAFDNDNGWLRRCVVNSSPLLQDIPGLHILPTANSFAPVPLKTEWRLEKLDVKKDGENVHVTMLGHYDNFKGGFEWTIKPDGEVDITSKFTYTGPSFRAREIGLSLNLPIACQKIRWSRQAEWNYYPDTEIGRPEGTALAFGAPNVVPPTVAYSQDQTPLGSNDFRSGKRHINWAEIGYPGFEPYDSNAPQPAFGASIRVESNGSQTFRAMVNSDHVSAYILDWYGGSNTNGGEWVANYGRGKEIKPGDVLETTIHLRF